MFCKSAAQKRQASASCKSARQECPKRASYRTVSPKCAARASSKSVSQECLNQASTKSVAQKCSARVSHKSVFVPQKGMQRVAYMCVSAKFVPQECQKECGPRVSHNSVLPRVCDKVSSKSVPLECHMINDQGPLKKTALL